MKTVVKTLGGKIKETTITITPKQYHLMEFDERNRIGKPGLVKIMKESVLKHGVLRLVIVVKNVETGGYIIVDGQHLTRALQQLNRPIECRVVECKTEEDMIQLMIDLNNICKTWVTNDYLRSWAESGKKEYKIIREKMSTSGIQLSVLLMAYTLKKRGIATKMMKEGTFKIADRAYGDKLVTYVKECNNFVPNTRAMNEALMNIMISFENYNHKKMLKNLKNCVKFVKFSTKEGEIFNQLKDIYEA